MAVSVRQQEKQCEWFGCVEIRLMVASRQIFGNLKKAVMPGRIANECRSGYCPLLQSPRLRQNSSIKSGLNGDDGTKP
jgi:hypothetical protein